jgi:hypothetical protein
MTPHFDRHTAYVAMSRHREAATMLYGAEDFRGRAPWSSPEHDRTPDPGDGANPRPRIGPELRHDGPEDDSEF